MKSTDSVIVNWDFSHGKDVGVLIVGKQEKGKVEIINAYQGEEAKALYQKLVFPKSKKTSFIKEKLPIMGLSKLSEECKNCPFVEKCKNKRMEALAYMTEPQVLANAADPSSENLAAPLLRETVTIMINGTPTQVYKDEIEKQLYSQLYSGLGLKFGS